MENKQYLSKLHAEILNILDEIVLICKKHNLKYYLIGGSLLGAVRHKGFIPWDDDLDIVMPREDFDQFTKKYYSELALPYILDWFTTNKDYNHLFAKVCNSKTLFEEEIFEGVTTSRGIFVDIFPMDESIGYSFEVRVKKKILNYTNRLIAEKLYQEKVKGFDRVLLNHISSYSLFQAAENIAKKPSRSRNDYYSNYSSQYNIRRQTHPIKNFGDGVLLPFEDRQYLCPDRYEDVLSSIFGENYMMPPPYDKRKTHYPIRVVFSDGQEVYFGKTENQLKIGKD